MKGSNLRKWRSTTRSTTNSGKGRKNSGTGSVSLSRTERDALYASLRVAVDTAIEEAIRGNDPTHSDAIQSQCDVAYARGYRDGEERLASRVSRAASSFSPGLVSR